jgi:hypothetical protein
MRLLFRLSLTVLSFLLILAVLWLSLPRLIVALTHYQLTQQGYSDVELVIGNIGLQSATVDSMRLSNDELSIELQWLKADYHFSGLLSGSVDSLIIDHAVVTRHTVNKKSDSALPDPVLLLAFLRSPWDEYIPTSSLIIKNLSVVDENGVLLTRSSVDIVKQGKEFSGEISFTDSKEEKHLMSLNVSPERGFSLQLQSLSATENETSPVAVRLKPADGMNGLTGQVNIDLSRIGRLLAGTDDLSGILQADLSYVSHPGKPKKDFSVAVEISEVQYESWQMEGVSINLQASIEDIEDGYRLEFEESSSVLVKSLHQESNGFEKLSLQLPHTLDIVSGSLVIPDNNGASITLKDVLLDDISIPEMQFRDIVLAGDQGNKELDPCTFKMQLTAPVVKSGGLHIKASPMQLDGTCPDVEEGKWSVNAAVINKKLPEESPAEFAGKLSCESSKQSGEVHSSFRFSPDSGAGNATYSVSDIDPDDKTPLFASLLKNWEEPYDLVTGKLSVKGKYRWWKNPQGKNRENLLMNLKLKDGGGYYDGILFSGLDYSDQIELLPYIKSSEFAELVVSDIDVGIPISSTKAKVRYSTAN